MEKITVLSLFIFCLNISCNKKKINQCDDKSLIIKAEVIFTEKYGEYVKSYKPFLLSHKNDTIILIRGSMKENEIGGYPYAQIDSRTCNFIKISHGK